MTDLNQITATLSPERLCILGGFHEDGGTVLMIGPDEPGGFWDHFKKSPEANDGQSHGMDRWSERVLGKIAQTLEGEVFFPFGGPPYHPFYTWALATGRIHESPIKLLVHDTAGLWVSFRGAVRINRLLPLPSPPPSPCDTCAGRPCLTACPAGVLGENGYDVPGCKGFLKTPDGQDCMNSGCRVRGACPVSKTWGRDSEQSAFHMEAFCPK